MLRLSGVAVAGWLVVLSLVEMKDGLRDSTADSPDGGKHVPNAAQLPPDSPVPVQLFQRTEIQAFTISPPLSLLAFSHKHLIKCDRLNISCRCNRSSRLYKI